MQHHNNSDTRHTNAAADALSCISHINSVAVLIFPLTKQFISLFLSLICLSLFFFDENVAEFSNAVF